MSTTPAEWRNVRASNAINRATVPNNSVQVIPTDFNVSHRRPSSPLNSWPRPSPMTTKNDATNVVVELIRCGHLILDRPPSGLSSWSLVEGVGWVTSIDRRVWLRTPLDLRHSERRGVQPLGDYGSSVVWRRFTGIINTPDGSTTPPLSTVPRRTSRTTVFSS